MAKSHDDAPWRARFEAIHRELRERITLLFYPPATRLDIDSLAIEFGVSRTPIRTVIHQLEREGLVVTRHGVGTLITDIDIRQFREATHLRMHLASLIPVLDPRPLGEMFKENLLHLRDACLALQDTQSFEEFARIDMRLHECVCGIIGNAPLRDSYDTLYYGCARMWLYFLPNIEWSKAVSALLAHTDMMLWAAESNDVQSIGSATRSAIFDGLYRLGELLEPDETH